MKLSSFTKILLLSFFLCPFSFLFSQIDQDTTNIETQESQETIISWDSLAPLQNVAPYDWVSYRMKMSMEFGDLKRTLQLFFVNRIDSVLYLNISMSAIELVRIVVTPEEVTYVNKLTNEYYLGSFEAIGSIVGIPLDFYMFQALLNGLDFKGFENNFTLLDQDTQIQLISEQRCDTLKDPPLCINQEIILDNQYRLIQNKLRHLTLPATLLVNYVDYKETETGDFFTKMEIIIPEIKVKMLGEIRSLKFNTPGPTSVKIPNSFTPVDWGN